MKLLIIFFSIFSFITFNSFALEKVEISDAIIRIPPPGLNVTAMFMTIKNKTDGDLKIENVEGDLAGLFELHNMEMSGGMMKMRKVDAIELKKQSSTVLKHGGLHIMIFNLKKELIENQNYEMVLTLSDRSKIKIQAIAKKM